MERWRVIARVEAVRLAVVVVVVSSLLISERESSWADRDEIRGADQQVQPTTRRHLEEDRPCRHSSCSSRQIRVVASFKYS